MKKNFLVFSVLFLFSCKPTKNITNYQPGKYYATIKSTSPIHIPKSEKIATASKKLAYPFIHINGFRNYDIKKSEYIKNNNSNYANELVFHATYSSFYTRNIMYNNFGNWDKNLFSSNKKTPFLIWEKVKLLPTKNETFYVVAGGRESESSKNNIYSSIVVLDSKGNDCLTDKNPQLKKEILLFFTNEIKNLNTDTEFYSKFWGLVLKKNDKK